MGSLVSDVVHILVDRIPSERLGRLALVQHNLLCALRRVGPGYSRASSGGRTTAWATSAVPSSLSVVTAVDGVTW